VERVEWAITWRARDRDDDVARRQRAREARIMMAARNDAGFCVRDAVETLIAADEMEPLDELASVLLFVSGAIAQARRRCESADVKAVELHAIDDAFSRSIKLTREVRERLQARRGRGGEGRGDHRGA
jgi:hypothetical protein